jgi:hypothetical protein
MKYFLIRRALLVRLAQLVLLAAMVPRYLEIILTRYISF